MYRKVGIVLVNYNGYDDTIECLKSLIEIDYDNYEIIVVDNASTVKPSQNTITFIENNSVFIKSDENLGFSGGNNIGIKRALEDECDYVLLLNNDTTVEADFLKILVDEAETYRDAGIICGKILYYFDKDRIWFAGGEFNYKRCRASHTLWNEINKENNAASREITFATGCLMLIPAEVIKRVGGLHEEYFLYCEDTDYCCRIMEAGYSIRYCDNAIIYHKINATTGTGSPLSQYYSVRNSLMLIANFSENKVYSYLYFFYITIKEIMAGKKKTRYCLRGLVDYIKRIQGKGDLS